MAECDAHLNEMFGPIAMGPLTGTDLTDGVRMQFKNGRVIHLRGSGIAPELRCYAEAESAEIAKMLVRETLAIVDSRF